MAEKLRLKVVTPTRFLLDEEVDEVTAPGALGEFGVLPSHISFLTLLDIGEMCYREGARRQYIAVSGGYAEVLDDVVTVLADAAELAQEIDVERAERARARAQKRSEEISAYHEDFPRVDAALRRAQVRLEVARKAGR